MLKHEEVACLLYEINRAYMQEKIPNLPDWVDLKDIVKFYWFSLAEGAIEALSDPDTVMLDAVIKESRKPALVEEGATWEDQQISNFVRLYQAGLEAIKVDWKLDLKKR